jgi:hypothetical protein
MENVSEIVDGYDELIPSRQIQFWTILMFEIPSLACIIYLLYHFLFDKNLRQALHNHVIIILLFFVFIVEVIDNPLYLDGYLHNGRSSFPSSPLICLIWLFVDYGVYGAITVFLTWASFERHILVFHYHQFMGTKLKRILFHYIPLGILFIYMTGFYLGVIVFPPCENIFDYELEACGMSPCYQDVFWLNIWDYLINGTMCTILEAIFSIFLLIRVIWKRHHAHRSIHWKKHRKMIIQLLSITTLSLSITLPQTLLTAVQEMIPGMNDFGSEVESYFFYLSSYVVLLLPFVTLGSCPELMPFKKRHQRAIVPFTMTRVRRHSIKAQPQTNFN